MREPAGLVNAPFNTGHWQHHQGDPELQICNHRYTETLLWIFFPHFLLFHLVSITATYQVLHQLLRGKKSIRYRPLSGIGNILKWLLFYLHFESVLQFHIFRETWVETDISEYVWNLAKICFKHLNKFLSVKNCVWLWITEESEITVLNKKGAFLLLK